MKIVNVFIVFLSVLITSISVAEEITPAGVGCDTVTGDCFILLNSEIKTAVSCGTRNQVRLAYGENGTPGQYAVALAAYMSGKNLELGAVHGPEGCHNDVVKPTTLYVID